MGIEYDVMKLRHDVDNLASYLKEHCKSHHVSESYSGNIKARIDNLANWLKDHCKSHPVDVSVNGFPEREKILTLADCKVGMWIKSMLGGSTPYRIIDVSGGWVTLDDGDGGKFPVPSRKLKFWRIHRQKPKLTAADCVGKLFRSTRTGKTYVGSHVDICGNLRAKGGDNNFSPEYVADYLALVPESVKEDPKPFVKVTDPEQFVRRYCDEHDIQTRVINLERDIRLLRKQFNDTETRIKF
jgi:hypothetical protein